METTARCAAITRSGERCRFPAMTGTLYCHGHSLDHAQTEQHRATLTDLIAHHAATERLAGGG